MKVEYRDFEIVFDEANLNGSITFEKCVSLNDSIIIGNCYMGAFSYTGIGSQIYNASIGRYCSIGKRVTIGPGIHDFTALTSHPFHISGVGTLKNFDSYKNISKKNKFNGNQKRTFIGNDVFIGDSVIIQKGVKIGDGAVIGSGAVVTKDVLPYEIVGGVPAKHIRMRFNENIIKNLLNIKWWNYSMENVAAENFLNPEVFLENIDVATLDVFKTDLFRFESKIKRFNKIDSEDPDLKELIGPIKS